MCARVRVFGAGMLGWTNKGEPDVHVRVLCAGMDEYGDLEVNPPRWVRGSQVGVNRSST